jgi:hypothetical protein
LLEHRLPGTQQRFQKHGIAKTTKSGIALRTLKRPIPVVVAKKLVLGVPAGVGD